MIYNLHTIEFINLKNKFSVTLHIHGYLQPSLWLILEYFVTSKRNPTSFNCHPNLLFLPSFKQPLTYFHFIFLCSGLMNKTMQYVAFCGWFYPSNISLYRYTMFCLKTHQLMGIWVIYTFWVLWIMLLVNTYSSFCLDMCFYFSWVYLYA